MSNDILSLYMMSQHPRDAARTLQQFDPKELAVFLDKYSISVTAIIFKHMVPSIAVETLKAMDLEKSAKIIMQLGVERGTLLLRRMSVGIKQEFISRMSPVYANMAKLVLRYPDGTVGHAMNPNVITISNDLTTGQVAVIARNSADILMNEIYVTNSDQHLVGVIHAKDILISASDQSIKNLIHKTEHTVSARSNLNSVKSLPNWQFQESFPVIDHHRVFVGVLYRSTLIESGGLADMNQDADSLTGTALAVAEIFWDACSNIIVPEHQNSNKSTTGDE